MSKILDQDANAHPLLNSNTGFGVDLKINHFTDTSFLSAFYDIPPSFIHSFIPWIYIVPLQGYYSEALPILARWPHLSILYNYQAQGR